MKIFHDVENKQINFLDERFYTKDNITYFPSVTTILDAYPKGYGFMQWLKDLGSNADEVVKRAGEQGSHIHDAIDKYLDGEELNWVNEKGEPVYTLDEWLMISRFVEFWTTYHPELLANEQDFISEKLGFGGTMDLVCKITGFGSVDGIWLIDYKSGAAIYKSFEFQLAAYEELWNEMVPDKKIQRRGCMHLRSMTRGVDKAGKNIQGLNWKLHEFDRKHEDAFGIFKHVQVLWIEENPTFKPKNKVYPSVFKLEKKEPEAKKGVENEAKLTP